MLANLRAAKVPQQQLLLPQTVQLAPNDARLLGTELAHFQALGYTIEPFGANAFLITAIPANLADNDISSTLADILADLRHESVTNRRSAIHLAQTASRHAIQKRDRLTRPEQEAILQELVHCQMPYTDPAGLPTMINITYAELRKRFQN